MKLSECHFTAKQAGRILRLKFAFVFILICRAKTNYSAGRVLGKQSTVKHGILNAAYSKAGDTKRLYSGRLPFRSAIDIMFAFILSLSVN